ncbi:BgtTE-56009 [Blumeria graminis f. sp. tritici]|uniref:BgtTE-56009 n=1 Tax=Blumeria graminis f. sp. tritici TaxID=62690 RepID=A0A9X9PR23_BLUGR|nr:BgtTE-56009 [Blumeria graminis f. sp. tritici]
MYPSKSSEMCVILSTIGLLVVESSAVSKERGLIRMRGSCNLEARSSLIIPEHKQPLSTNACTILESLIKALIKNGVVFIIIS